jgi:hypothetical protein
MTSPPAAARAASRSQGRGVCPACGRETGLTFHHLIPRKVHRRQFFKKNYSKQQLGQGIYLCRLCHDGIHDRFDELTLAKRFADPVALLHESSLQSHFKWVARQRTL